MFVLRLNSPEDRKKILQGLRSASGHARHSLGQRLHHLKRIPELTFDYDDTLEQELRIEQLLDQIKTKDK